MNILTCFILQDLKGARNCVEFTQVLIYFSSILFDLLGVVPLKDLPSCVIGRPWDIFHWTPCNENGF